MQPRDWWNKMFGELDDEGQQFVIVVLQGEYDRVRASRRARLRLIDCAQLPTNLSNNQVKPLAVSGTG